MLPTSVFSKSLSVLLVGIAAAGCVDDVEHAKIETTMKSDGYALFAVDNDRQQRNDVSITVRDVDANATYVMIYSNEAPKNVGWFRFDPSTKSRCGGDIGPHCEIPGYGYLVDVVTVPEGASEITLRDDKCGCDADREESDWTGHWAVMRIERPNRTTAVRLDVWAKSVKNYAVKPDLTQLQ